MKKDEAKVGMRVLITEEQEGRGEGCKATIKGIKDKFANLEVDEFCDEGHSCDGLTKGGKGWNVVFSKLKKLENTPTKFFMVASQWDDDKKNAHGNEWYEDDRGHNSPPRTRFPTYEEAHKVAVIMTQKYGHSYYVLEAIEHVKSVKNPITTTKL